MRQSDSGDNSLEFYASVAFVQIVFSQGEVYTKLISKYKVRSESYMILCGNFFFSNFIYKMKCIYSQNFELLDQFKC